MSCFKFPMYIMLISNQNWFDLTQWLNLEPRVTFDLAFEPYM